MVVSPLVLFDVAVQKQQGGKEPRLSVNLSVDVKISVCQDVFIGVGFQTLLCYFQLVLFYLLIKIHQTLHLYCLKFSCKDSVELQEVFLGEFLSFFFGR